MYEFWVQLKCGIGVHEVGLQVIPDSAVVGVLASRFGIGFVSSSASFNVGQCVVINDEFIFSA